MNERTPCPVPGCGGSRRHGDLMCRDCWRQVPKKQQLAVHHTWKAYLRANRQPALAVKIAALNTYRLASETAIGAVGKARA